MTVHPAVFTPSRQIVSPLRIFVALAAAIMIAGAFFAGQRTWANLLLAGDYVVGIGIGALLFVAIHYTTGAGWDSALRRIPEAIAGIIPLGGFLVIAAIVFGGATLYPALSHQPHELTYFKGLWLSPGFFFGRTIFYVITWIFFAHAIRRNSLLQDESGAPRFSKRNVRLSYAFLIVYAFTAWLSGVDWIMALEPHWFSTMFGVYHFAGMFVAAIAAVIVFTVGLRRAGLLKKVVNEHHLHDLGKLLFAFSTFWMYIWFSQFMLIWYSNIPEESIYFTRRMNDGWMTLFILNVVVNWIVPFFVLLSQSAKKSENVLFRVSLLILAGHWLDLYVSIFPNVMPAGPQFGGWEIATLLGTIGAAVLIIFEILRRHSLVPVGDPYLEESLHHHG